MFVLARVAGVMPGGSGIAGYYYRFKLKCVRWVGTHVLGLDEPLTHLRSNSGDQLFDWIQVVTLLGLALIVAAFWVFFDRANRSERIAVELVRIVVRFRLGVTMLGYGIDKILRRQMPEPDMLKLLQPYGESSPMGLLWTFMGQSWAYSAFTGALELLGGLLLLFRRTTTLGALIVVAVMANVLMLNFGFDVPVKLYSIHYLVFAAALVMVDLRRVADVFVFNHATLPVPSTSIWPQGRATRLVRVIHIVAVGGILWYVPVQRSVRWAERSGPTTSELAGLYDVVSFSRAGIEAPPLITDTARWRRVAFDERGMVTIVFMNDARINFRFQPGPRTGVFMLEPFEGAYARGEVFTYVRDGAERLSIKGALNHAPVQIELRRADDQKLLLRNRGFRWITDYDLNR